MQHILLYAHFIAHLYSVRSFMKYGFKSGWDLVPTSGISRMIGLRGEAKTTNLIFGILASCHLIKSKAL